MHLLGQSYGVFTAALTVGDRPDLLRSLVICEPPILALLVSNPATARLYDEYESKVLEPTKDQFRMGEYV